MSDFDAEFEKLAESIATEAKSAATPLPDKVDALKALYPYYALRQKSKPDEGPEDGTMADLARRIQSAEDGDGSDLERQPWISGGGQRN